MKMILLSAILAIGQTTMAAGLSPMELIEKSAHTLDALVKKKNVDASYQTDVMTVLVAVQGATSIVEMRSPSDDTAKFNSLRLTFNDAGALVKFDNKFVGKLSTGPVFSKADAATILDLGAEAVVDHLTESPDLVTVSETAKAVQVIPEKEGPLLQITLEDGRLYKIQMDADGKVLSQGF